MTLKKWTSSLLVATLLNYPIIASSDTHGDYLDQLVVTANRRPSPLDKLGASAYVLDRAMIEGSSADNLPGLLKQVPGLNLRNNGGMGSAANLSIRGVEPKYVLVLLNGMELADPIGNGGDRQGVIHDLNLDEVERIEVIKGPQSTLWGSDAMGGVVNIITRKPSDESFFKTSFEMGTHGYAKGVFSASGKQEKLGYRLNYGKVEQEGFSASSASRGNTEVDGYDSRDIQLNLDWENSAFSNTSLFYSYQNSNLDTDGGFGIPADTLDRFHSRHRHFQFVHSDSSQDGRFEQNFGIKNSLFETLNQAFGISEFKGSVNQIFWKGSLELERHSLTFGWETEQDRGQSLVDPVYKSRTNAFFFEDSIELSKSLNLSVGGRLDNHSNFGEAKSYRISPSYRRGKSRFRGSLGTGFKAPTLYQLNAVATSRRHFDFITPAPFVRFNNPNLRPTQSRGVEFGWDYQIDERLSFGITRFSQKLKDAILFAFDSVTFTGPFGFVNQDALDSKGYEFDLDYKLNERSRLSYHQMHVKSTNRNNGLQLRRQPVKTAWVHFSYQKPDGLGAQISLREVGDQIESYPNAFSAGQTLPSYRVVDLALSHSFGKEFEVQLSVQNLLDKDYEEVFGFANGGRMFRFKVSRRF